MSPASRSCLLPATISLAVVLSSLGAGCAHPPWNPYKNWQIVRSKYVTAYANTRIRPRVTLEAMDLAYATLHASFFRKKAVAPVEALLLEWSDFHPLMGRLRMGATVSKLPGKGFYARRGLVVMFGEDTTNHNALHRMAHLFLHAVAPEAPLWLHEGLATYVETAQYRGEGATAVACLGHPPGKSPDIPLAELFSWSWQGYDESKKSTWYRTTAAQLIDYFMSGEDGALRERLADLIGEIATGTETAAALEKVYGLGVAALEQKARDHRRKSEMTPRGLCPIPFPVPPDKTGDGGELRREPAETADIEALFARVRMLPRRGTYVDWYPPDKIGLGGGQFNNAGIGR